MAVDPTALAQSLSMSRQAQQLPGSHHSIAAEFECVSTRITELRNSYAGNHNVLAALDSFDREVAPLAGGSGDLPENTDLKSIGEALRSIETDHEASDRTPTEGQQRALAEKARRLDRALSLWKESRLSDLAHLNAGLERASLAPREGNSCLLRLTTCSSSSLSCVRDA